MNRCPLLTSYIYMFVVTSLMAGCGPLTSGDRTSKNDLRSPLESADASRSPVVLSEQASAEINAIVGSQCSKGQTTKFINSAKEFSVSAKAYWVNSGLYLQPGDSFQVQASGSWTVWENETPDFTAAGDSRLTPYEGCTKGSLVGRIGLPYEGPRFCIGEQLGVGGGNAIFTANAAGILYFGINDGGSASYHAGALQVTVTPVKATLTAVTFSADQVAQASFCDASSAWVELESSEHVVLTVPAALAEESRASLTQTLAAYDQLYDALKTMMDAEPFGGERIRYFPDFEVRQVAWMLAGNPILYDPKNLNAAPPSESRILDPVGLADSKPFELIRAMAVSFSRAKSRAYQGGDKAPQAWGGLLAQYALEQLGPTVMPVDPCAARNLYFKSGNAATFLADPWLQLCFLGEFQKKYGWDFYKDFFSNLPEADDATETVFFPTGQAPKEVWASLRTLFDLAAGESTEAIFKQYFLLP